MTCSLPLFMIIVHNILMSSCFRCHSIQVLQDVACSLPTAGPQHEIVATGSQTPCGPLLLLRWRVNSRVVKTSRKTDNVPEIKILFAYDHESETLFRIASKSVSQCQSWYDRVRLLGRPRTVPMMLSISEGEDD